MEGTDESDYLHTVHLFPLPFCSYWFLSYTKVHQRKLTCTIFTVHRGCYHTFWYIIFMNSACMHIATYPHPGATSQHLKRMTVKHEHCVQLYRQAQEHSQTCSHCTEASSHCTYLCGCGSFDGTVAAGDVSYGGKRQDCSLFCADSISNSFGYWPI